MNERMLFPDKTTVDTVRYLVAPEFRSNGILK